MADSSSKTETATSKRRQDERKKGNVFLSKDMVTVVSLLGMFSVLKLLMGGIFTAMREFLYRILHYVETVEVLSESFLVKMTEDFLTIFVRAVGILFAVSILIAVIVTATQTKMLFTWDALKPKFSKLNPLNGIKNMISLKSLVEVIKGSIKITILFAIIYNFFLDALPQFIRTLDMGIMQSSVFLLENVMSLIYKVSIAFIAVSILDYFYQWWDYERQIKMSKQEVKEEYKQMEGDPKIKGKIKEMQRKIAMSRMMQSVPQADVVIKNPTHYAVALKYDIDKDNAPRLVAKGQDELALRIIEVAQENGVYVIENKPLARSIYAMTDLNGEIPPEFYGMVAELLVIVYKANHRL